MVSVLSIVFMFITLAICFGVPLVFLILLFKRTRSAFLCALWGALGFFVTQICIRIPLLSSAPVQSFFSTMPLIPTYLFLAFTAALFETAGRYGVFRLFFKKPQYGYYEGLAAGVGHGGIEAIILVGFTYINNIVFSFLLNTGGLQSFLSSAGLSIGDINALTAQLTEIAPAAFLASGAERLLTMVFHIVLSVTLFSYMKTKKTAVGFAIVVALHTCVDFFIPLLQFATGNILLTEIALFVFVAASLALLKPSKKRFQTVETISDIS